MKRKTGYCLQLRVAIRDRNYLRPGHRRDVLSQCVTPLFAVRKARLQLRELDKPGPCERVGKFRARPRLSTSQHLRRLAPRPILRPAVANVASGNSQIHLSSKQLEEAPVSRSAVIRVELPKVSRKNSEAN